MRYAVIGAGGFSLEVADMLTLMGHHIAAFIDEKPTGSAHPLGGPIMTSLDGLSFDAAAIAIGSVDVRERLLAVLLGRGVSLPPLVHPSASVSPFATLGAGAVVMNNAVISATATLEPGCLINVGAYVAHGCRVGACTHLASGVRLGGMASTGVRCLCGTNSVLLPHVSIGDDVTCGAGAVVTADVDDGLTVAGVPARVLGDVAADE